MRAAFTLLEVMLAVMVVGIAMMALLELHHNNLQAVIRSQDLTRASMLAQTVMSTAEVERFPPTGTTHGDFSQFFPGEFSNFSWERDVRQEADFPDLREVRVRVFYGSNGNRSFQLIELLHNPNPPPLPNATGANDSDTQDSSPQ